MANIFINGVKANAGGGKAILNNYLTLLRESSSRHKFFVLTPDREQYLKYACDFVEIVEIDAFYKKNAVFPLLYYFVLPRLLKALKIDMIFNFGDVIIPTKVSQVYMFDWAYAIYPECVAWQRMSLKDYFTRKLKVFLIKKYIKKTQTVIGQTGTVCRRIKQHLGLKEVELVPSAVNLENFENKNGMDFNLPAEKFKLLYLSTYSSHKNFEILIPLAKKIKAEKLPYSIIITIDSGQHKLAKKFLDKIEEHCLEDIILNMGHVNAENVGALYRQCDALLMPTLLESYGLPYVEAMYHQKTILTSNYDFAEDVCEKAAFYFDPLDENSIVAAVNQAYSNFDERLLKIKAGDIKIKQLFSWPQVFDSYQELLEKNINEIEK